MKAAQVPLCHSPCPPGSPPSPVRSSRLPATHGLGCARGAPSLHLPPPPPKPRAFLPLCVCVCVCLFVCLRGPSPHGCGKPQGEVERSPPLALCAIRIPMLHFLTGHWCPNGQVARGTCNYALPEAAPRPRSSPRALPAAPGRGLRRAAGGGGGGGGAAALVINCGKVLNAFTSLSRPPLPARCRP